VMAGSDHGAAVIPFAPDQSLALQLLEGRAASTTVDHAVTALRQPRTDDRGAAAGDPVAAPSIDLGGVATLRTWVADGCRDDGDTPAFADVTDKVFVTGQQADLIAEISVDDLVVTRLIQVEPFSTSGGLRALPHFGAVSQDNTFWIATMLEAPGLWKFSAEDSVLARLETTVPNAALAVMTPDGAKAYVTHFVNPQSPALGTVTVVDLASFTILDEVPVLNVPHGIAIAPDGGEVYVGNFGSDHITVIDTSDDSVVDFIPLSETVRGNTDSFEFRVIQLATHPTAPLIYASCTATNEIRVIDRQAATVVDSVTVPAGSAAPWHLRVSDDGSTLFVANRGQQLNAPEILPGSVSIYATNPRLQLVANVTDDALWLPHGIALDPSGQLCFVSSENLNGGYTARHPVAGANPPGTLTVIDASPPYAVVKVLEVPAFATGVFATRPR